MSKIDFTGRVAIVTGSGGGLGRTHAEMLAERGARVVVNDLAKAEETVAELRERGFEAIAGADDISTPEGARNVVAAAVETFGRLDILVNNAAVGRFSPMDQTTVEEYQLVRSAGLDSAFYVTREAWPHMVEAGYGRVLMTTSGTGLISDVDAVSYTAAKAGCYGLMRACSHDGADHNIKVNALSPQAWTPMTVERTSKERGEAMRKIFPTSLVSPIAVLLCSEECPVTGRVLEAGGGRVGSFFVGVTPGYYAEEMSPESLLEAWPLPIDQSEWTYHESARAAMGASRDAAMRNAGVDPTSNAVPVK